MPTTVGSSPRAASTNTERIKMLLVLFLILLCLIIGTGLILKAIGLILMAFCAFIVLGAVCLYIKLSESSQD